MFEITKEKTRSRRFMVSTRNSNAMAEVIYYLKGIRAEDIEKIPKKFMMKMLPKNISAILIIINH